MRYLTALLAVILYCCPSYAGDKAKGAGAWAWACASVKPVAAKPVQPAIAPKAIAKTCPCSNQCACGCNSGKECTCNQTPPVTQTGRQFVPAQYQSSVCIGGT